MPHYAAGLDIQQRNICKVSHAKRNLFSPKREEINTRKRTVNQEHNSRVYTKTKLCHQANIPTKCLENEI